MTRPPATSRTTGISTARPAARAGARRSRRSFAALALVLAGPLAAAVPGTSLAAPVPGTPAGLPAGVEDLQPYVGQLGCDPVAKPGVLAFSRLLMDTYRDTGSLGIVRDCGIGGTSEHKEGRAFDWAVSVTNANHVAEVQAVTQWLTATENGYVASNARRFGIMYMIWNRQIWKAYDWDRGWQPYSGASPHTDHVHFSFGWNGAKQATSWWTKRVAPVDYGPYSGGENPDPPDAPDPVNPVRVPDNIKVLALYGQTTLQQGDSGAAVAAMQKGLTLTADGSFGPITAARVRDFQTRQSLPVTGVFGPADWAVLFPRPVDPFGYFDAVSSGTASGWVIDPDTASPISIEVTVDGVRQSVVVADRSRPDLPAAFPGLGSAHGYSVPLNLAPGLHTVCITARNVGAGADTNAGCRTADERPVLSGASFAVRQGVPGERATGDLAFTVDRPSDWRLEVRRGSTPVAAMSGTGAGRVTSAWNGRDLSGRRLPAGSYTAVLTASVPGATSTAWSQAFALTAADADLYTVVTSGTGSGRVEVHALSRRSGYRDFSVHEATEISTVDSGRWQFLFGPYDDSGRRDLYAVATRGTASGKVEVHVLSAASGYKQWVEHVATALPLTGATRVDYALSSFAGSGRPDLFAVFSSGGASGRVEVHVMSAASTWTQFVEHSATALTPGSPGQWTYLVGDAAGRGDLVALARTRTGSGSTEVHTLTKDSGYQSFSEHAVTPLGLTPGQQCQFSLVEINGDGVPDLSLTLLDATGSERTEVHALSGTNHFQDWVEHAASGLGEVDPATWSVGVVR